MTNFLKDKFGKFNHLDGILVLIMIVGVMVAGSSLFRGILGGSQAQIEYLDSTQSINVADGYKVMVDIEGAVMSPGVYELPPRSRIKDVLVMAGGYTAEADRLYCEKNLNLAQELKDGQKIFIPDLSDTPAGGGYTEAKSQVKTINVNTASLSELDTLWGVGPARADTIVKNRPYNSMEELVSKGGMSKQILEKNMELIVLY